MLEPVRYNFNTLLKQNVLEDIGNKKIKEVRRLGSYTSLIGAMVSSIAVGIVKEKWSEERLRAKDSLSVMPMGNIICLL